MQVRTWFGVFTLDNNGITDVELFEKNSIVNRLLNENLLIRGTVAGIDIGTLAVKYGFAVSIEEYDRLLHKINIELVQSQITRSVTPDRKIIAAVEALDDINETANLLSERLKEWYVLNFDTSELKASDLANHVIRMEENGNELKVMKNFATNVLGLYQTRSSIEEHLKEKMTSFAPNLTSISGHILGARLLSISGSLKKLASMPSSTIQVIGANNALFKHLKGKAPSPKHGLIFRHPLVITAPKKLRGKIARAVASKISLAVRYDLYAGEIKSDLPGELEKKVSEIKKQHPKRS